MCPGAGSWGCSPGPSPSGAQLSPDSRPLSWLPHVSRAPTLARIPIRGAGTPSSQAGSSITLHQARPVSNCWEEKGDLFSLHPDPLPFSLSTRGTLCPKPTATETHRSRQSRHSGHTDQHIQADDPRCRELAGCQLIPNPSEGLGEVLSATYMMCLNLTASPSSHHATTQMRKLRLRGAVTAHSARKWRSWGSNPGSLLQNHAQPLVTGRENSSPRSQQGTETQSQLPHMVRRLKQRQTPLRQETQTSRHT